MSHLKRGIALLALACLSLLAAGQQAAARRVPIEIVVKVGDPLGSSIVSGVQSPFTDGNGRVGFVGALESTERFIWYDGGPIFFSGDALPLVLTGGESTMGVSDTGGFIYSPSVDGGDAVFTHGGPLLVEGDAFPPDPELYVTFNSRPQMLPDGTAFWICGTATTPGGSSTNRHLLRASDPTDPGTIARVLGGGDVIEGKTISTAAGNFSYSLSDNGAHHIQVLDMDVAASNHVYLDGGFVAQEGQPTGQGDNWSTFDIVSVNNFGSYIFTGDTDGAVETDEFVAWNSEIVLREGDTLDGITLGAGAALRAASVNNNDEVAHIWGFSAEEHLFLGSGPQLGDSRRVLSLGDSLDATGDEIPEWILTDFAASPVIGPGLDLHTNGWIYVRAELAPIAGGTEVDAVIGVEIPPAMAVGESPQGPGVFLELRPNPFVSNARIRVVLFEPGRVRLDVFDMNGRLLRRLADRVEAAGLREWTWDGRDRAGRQLPAGAYFLRMEAAGRIESVKLVRLD